MQLKKKYNSLMLKVCDGAVNKEPLYSKCIVIFRCVLLVEHWMFMGLSPEYGPLGG